MQEALHRTCSCEMHLFFSRETQSRTILKKKEKIYECQISKGKTRKKQGVTQAQRKRKVHFQRREISRYGCVPTRLCQRWCDRARASVHGAEHAFDVLVLVVGRSKCDWVGAAAGACDQAWVSESAEATGRTSACKRNLL